jgi:hypothetical protein
MPRRQYMAISAAGNVGLVGQVGSSTWERRFYSSQLDTWATFPWASAPSSNDQALVLATGPQSFFQAWYNLSAPSFATLSPMGVSAETLTSASAARASSMHAASTVDGDVALVWADGNKVLRGRFIAPTGLKMGGEALHTEPAIVGQLPIPVVAPAPGGDAYVFWERRNNDLTVQLLMMTLRDLPTGPTFDAPMVLVQTTTSLGFEGIQPLVDSADDITLTWIDLDLSTKALRRIGGTWGTPVTVGAATDSAIANNRRATIDRSGHVTVIFRRTGPGRVEHRRIERGSTTWGAPVATSTMTTCR